MIQSSTNHTKKKKKKKNSSKKDLKNWSLIRTRLILPSSIFKKLTTLESHSPKTRRRRTLRLYCSLHDSAYQRYVPLTSPLLHSSFSDRRRRRSLSATDASPAQRAILMVRPWLPIAPGAKLEMYLYLVIIHRSAYGGPCWALSISQPHFAFWLGTKELLFTAKTKIKISSATVNHEPITAPHLAIELVMKIPQTGLKRCQGIYKWKSTELEDI